MGEFDTTLAQAAVALWDDPDQAVMLEAADVLRAERARATLADRLAAADVVRLGFAGGPPVSAQVAEVGSDVVVLRSEADELVVRLAAVLMVRGLPGALGDRPSGSPIVRNWAQLVRRALDQPVRVHLRDGVVLSGVLAAVGRDHLDLVVETGEVVTIADVAINCLRRRRVDD